MGENAEMMMIENGEMGKWVKAEKWAFFLVIPN
jgi:hypothetical protein